MPLEFEIANLLSRAKSPAKVPALHATQNISRSVMCLVPIVRLVSAVMGIGIQRVRRELWLCANISVSYSQLFHWFLSPGD